MSTFTHIRPHALALATLALGCSSTNTEDNNDATAQGDSGLLTASAGTTSADGETSGAEGGCGECMDGDSQCHPTDPGLLLTCVDDADGDFEDAS